MVLFVGIEPIPVFIEAEGFMGHEISILCIVTVLFQERLVSRVQKDLSSFILHLESELLHLGGADIEDCEFITDDPSFISAFMDREYNPLSNEGNHLFGKDGAGDIFNEICQLLVAINGQISFILSLGHGFTDSSYEPDHAEDVVSMGMGHKYIMD